MARLPPPRPVAVFLAASLLSISFVLTVAGGPQASAQTTPSAANSQDSTPPPITEKEKSGQTRKDLAQKDPAKKDSGQSCISPTLAAQEPNKDVCVSARVYDVVELADGTRFLDICPPDLPDEVCRFTILSLPSDRDDVGDLTRYRNQQVEVRGIVRSTRGRMGIVLSHVRQFHGGPEKFRPNPKLLHGFNGQSDRTPVRDPNLAPTGRHRSFMDSHDKETISHNSK